MATQELGRQPAFTGPATSETDPRSWVSEIPEAHRRPLRLWMWTGAALTASTLVIGGITRLTESGLSIVDWAPIVGTIPPLGDADWQEAFARYQQFPEYVKLRPDMTLSEFKTIYYWEYLHRMIGRVIGAAFLLPFLYFWIRGYFTRPLLRRTGLLFALGGLQGLMGWYMVSSGLVDRPEVSHYRLAAHLLLAISIFGCCLWFGNDLLDRERHEISPESRTFMMRALIGVGALLMVQVFWGALVAGLNAGLILNTFPFMNGSLLPPQGWSQQPVLVNLFENLATVQWMHRVLATVLLVAGVTLAVKTWRDPALATFRLWSAGLAAMIVLQYLLGVLTLLSHVRIGLGVAHQFVALSIVGVLLTFLHRVWVSSQVTAVARTSSPDHS